jgi:hypothetical protein
LIHEGLHLSSGAETLSAVVIGAVLATAGGFAASQMEAFLRRRERERGAALLFGEILSVIELIAGLAIESRGRGDPYGPFTMRLLRAVRRETEAYDRNRESLYDLRDAKIRARIHTLMVRLILSMDGFYDSSDQIAALRGDAIRLDPDSPARAEVMAQIEAIAENREGAFVFAMETVEQIGALLAVLQPLAKQSFDAHRAVVRAP